MRRRNTLKALYFDKDGFSFFFIKDWNVEIIRHFSFWLSWLKHVPSNAEQRRESTKARRNALNDGI